MQRRILCGALVALSLVVSTTSATAQDEVETIEISFEQALDRARANAPRLTVARAELAESDAQVAAARVWRGNPRFEAAAGPRVGASTSVDVSVGLEQPLPLGPERRRSIARAEAQRDVARAGTRRSEHELLSSVASVFVELLYWKEERARAAENLALAHEIERVAQARHAAGDVGVLDETLASLAGASAQSDVTRAEANGFSAASQLKVLLGIDGAAALSPLGDLASFGRLPAGEGSRPEIAQLEAALTEVEAGRRLAKARRFPGVSVGLEYSHEDEADVLLGVLSFTLPVFDRGQGDLAIAVAAHQRVQAELDELNGVARTQVVVATKRVASLDRAVRDFASTGLANAQRAQEIASASYAAGAIALPELLAIRRELTASRRDFTQLLLELAHARVELITSRGQW